MSIHLHQAAVGEINRHIDRWLDRLGLLSVARAPIRSFSKGMTQRVAIAQAMCINPRLLVMDEPLSGLDPVGRQEVVEILADYKRQGGTLFFTSHVGSTGDARDCGAHAHRGSPWTFSRNGVYEGDWSIERH
mgnify:CR=1 FL=1